jgi:hypothetical protein
MSSPRGLAAYGHFKRMLSNSDATRSQEVLEKLPYQLGARTETRKGKSCRDACLIEQYATKAYDFLTLALGGSERLASSYGRFTSNLPSAR